MAIDAHANFGVSSVAVAPSPATTGTSLTVATGEGTRFPAVPFNATLAPAGVLATPANAEIVRVTARTGDVLTIMRAVEGTVARAVVVGDLCVASITAKALQDIETGFARLDAANTYASNAIQTIQYDGSGNPRLVLTDLTAPANSRVFGFINYGQQLTLRALTDAIDPVTDPLILDRAGNAKVGNDIYEKQRTTPLGHWLDVPFNAANFTTSGSMTWTVASGNQTTFAYYLIGKTITISFVITGTSIGGTPDTFLLIRIPGGYIPNRNLEAVGWANDGGTNRILRIRALAGDANLYLLRLDGVNWTASVSNTGIQGQVMVSIS